MTDAMHTAVVEFDLNQLLRLLRFPDGARVVAAHVPSHIAGPVVRVQVEHRDLPLTQPGFDLLRVRPTLDAFGFKNWGNL